MLRFWILFSFIFSYITCDSQIIQGKVLGENNIPIENALVVAVDYEISTRTTKLGEFSFTTEFKQTVKIKISAVGYETFLGTVNPTENQTIVTLNKSHIDIEEVVVVSNYKGLLQKNNVTHIEVRKIAELKSIPTINLGEALATIPGVYQTSTGNGISKPVIRGLQGTRVVTLLNGLRIENQQWGADHGLGLTETGIGNIELIKGPASLIYGSGAMAGVVNLIEDKDASKGEIDGYLNLRGYSNTLGFRSEAGVKGTSDNGFIWAFNGAMESHADYLDGDGRTMGNTRFNTQNFKGGIGLQKKYKKQK
jgi:iron complex outermembrane receptor protein